MSPEEIFERNRKRLEANKRLIALNMQSNKPPAKPKQSFFNKVRDKFDANTEADQYRRQVKGDARLYSDQQKNMGRTRISNNPFQRGTNTFRSLAETIKQPYEKLGTGISTAFGEGASLRDYEAKTQQENLTHVENLRKQLTKPTTSLADRAVLRSKIGIASTAAQNSYNRQIKQTQQLERDADPLKQAGNIIQIGTDLAGLGVAGFAGKKFGKDVAQLGWKQASARALPAVGQNAAINTIQGGSGELQSDDPTVAGMFRKAALGAGVGTVADLTLGGFAALPSNRAYKNVVKELANETDGAVVRDTVKEIANDLPEETIDDISKQITKATDEATVDGIIKKAALEEGQLTNPIRKTFEPLEQVPTTGTVTKDPAIIYGFKQAKTPEQARDSVKALFPDLDDTAVTKLAQDLAKAQDDASITKILERAQASRKAVTEGVDNATPTGEIAPTPEQQIAEVAQNQPTAQLTSKQAPDADIQANQVVQSVDEAAAPVSAVQDAVAPLADGERYTTTNADISFGSDSSGGTVSYKPDGAGTQAKQVSYNQLSDKTRTELVTAENNYAKARANSKGFVKPGTRGEVQIAKEQLDIAQSNAIEELGLQDYANKVDSSGNVIQKTYNDRYTDWAEAKYKSLNPDEREIFAKDAKANPEKYKAQFEAEYRSTFYDSLDVPKEDLIIRDGSGKAMSIDPKAPQVGKTEGTLKSAEDVIKENSIREISVPLVGDQKFKVTRVKVSDLLKRDTDLAEYVKTNPGKSRFYKNQEPTTALPVIGKRVGEPGGLDQVIDGYGRIKQAVDDGKEYIDVNLSTDSDLNSLTPQPPKTVAPVEGKVGQVVAPEVPTQTTRAVADANPEIVVPESVTNAESLSGQFQKQLVDKDANYINYLKQVEKDTGQTGLVDQFYYDSGLQRRSNSIANNQTTNSQNLSQAFEGLTGDAKNNFDQYVALRNEISNAKRGLKTAEKLDVLEQRAAQLAPENAERFAALNNYYKEWAGRLREAGIIDDATFKSFVQNDDYTHIQRVMDDIAGYSGTGGNSFSLGTSKARLKRKGSERAVQPADITALNYAQKMQSEIQRNQTASNMIDVLVEQGHAKKLPAGQTARKNTIKRIVDGKTEVFEVPRDIKEVADNITPFQLGTLGKIVAAPQRVLRAGATGLSAPFTAANYVKDQVGSAVFSKNAVATHLDPRNAMSGLWNATKDTLGESNDPLWKKFIESSGDTTGYDFLRNAKSAKQASREVRLGTKGKYANMAGSPIRTLEELNAITEKATRFQNFKGIYQDTLNKTGNEADALRTATLAAWQNSVDFSRMGNTAQAINLLIPYFNAGIQGTRLLGRRFGEAPVATSLKTLGLVALPMTGLTLYNMADEKRKAVYDNISDYEKENNLIIVLPNAKQLEDGSYDGVIKVPLQPGLVNLAQPFRMQAENFASKSNQNEVAQMAQQFFGAFAGPVGTGSFRELEGSLTPQIVKPFTQQNANEDKFTGKEIVPGYIDNATDAQGNPVAEKDKAYDFTSGTARAIGGKLGISPLRVEKFIKDTTAKTGLYALNTADNALAKLGKIPQEQIGGISVKDDIVRRFARAQGKYNYKKPEGGKYYDLVKDVTKGLNGNEKAAWDSIHPSKTNFLGEDIFDENKRLAKYTKAGLYLQHPNVFAAEKAIEMEQRKKGNPANPLYDLPQDQLTKVLLKDALPPGAKDPELSNLYKEEWYKDYKNKTSAFYTALKDKLSKQGKSLPKTDNPYPVASPELQKSMDAYSALPKGTGARSSWIRSNPDTWNAMTTQWQATDDWENKERVKIGLNPIEDEESKSGGSGYGKFGYSKKGGKSGSGGGSGKTAKLKTPKTYITELLGNVPNISSDEIAIRTAPKRAKFKVKTPSGKGRNYKKIKLN